MKHGLILDSVARQNQLCLCGQMSGGFIGLWCGLMDSWIWKSSVLCQVTRLREEGRLRRKNSSRSLPEPQPMAVVPIFVGDFRQPKKSVKCPPQIMDNWSCWMWKLMAFGALFLFFLFVKHGYNPTRKPGVSVRIGHGIVVGRRVIKCGWKIPSKNWRVEWEKYLFYWRIPSGELTYCSNWKWPFIVDFPIKNGDFPLLC